MEIQPKQPSSKGPPHMFTGDVWFDVIAQGSRPPASGSTPCTSHPAPTPRGTAMPTVRRCTSPKGSAWSRLAEAR